jgi:hypothetical protein
VRSGLAVRCPCGQPAAARRLAPRARDPPRGRPAVRWRLLLEETPGPPAPPQPGLPGGDVVIRWFERADRPLGAARCPRRGPDSAARPAGFNGSTRARFRALHDESIGLGGLLARSAADGVETHLVTATRGEAGRYRAGPDHPGPAALARIREAELDAAAGVLGVRSVHLFGHADGRLREVEPAEGAAAVAAHIRRVRPHVLVTFGPDGVYGHPDHIAVGEWARAATVLAADASFAGETRVFDGLG